MRVSGPIPERLSGGDDSSENSSESSCYEVMDTNGEIVVMAKRLTCRVRVPSPAVNGSPKRKTSFPLCLCPSVGADQRGHRAAAQPVQLCLLSVHFLGLR